MAKPRICNEKNSNQKNHSCNRTFTAVKIPRTSMFRDQKQAYSKRHHKTKVKMENLGVICNIDILESTHTKEVFTWYD